jgi:cellulose synthase/poly-beta-1,6-N-acetylglucosamine synthase-like glycosyltransferase
MPRFRSVCWDRGDFSSLIVSDRSGTYVVSFRLKIRMNRCILYFRIAAQERIRLNAGETGVGASRFPIQDDSRMKLSVIIPSYNEHRTIDAVIEKVRRVQVPGFEKEIIVVDGHSIDGTREILLAHEGESDFQVIFESAPQGRGHALKEGLKVATGDVVIFRMRSRLDPEDYPALLEP